MRILFIKTGHIGDALVMTPTMVAVKNRYPDAVIWTVVRAGSDSILCGCPEIDKVLTTSAPEKSRRSPVSDLLANVRLLRLLRAQKFDVAVELSESRRGRWIAFLSGAKKRACDGSARPLTRWWRRWFTELRLPKLERKLCHRTTKDIRVAGEVLDLPAEAPPLRFAREQSRPWEKLRIGGRLAVIHPGTRWERKRWPVERWAVVARHLCSLGLQIVISTGPDERDMQEAADLVQRIGPNAQSTDGQTDWSQLAHILFQAEIFVGVDTAAMHLAAACQRPVVALFGPSKVPYWHPWKTPHQVVLPPDTPDPWLPQNVLQPMSSPKTGDIRVEDVIAACDRLLADAVSSK